MILEVTFNNYRLFQGDSSLSFLADGRTKTLMSNSIEIDKRNVLKSVAIYGPNNSGKTNLLELFKVIKSVLLGITDFTCNDPVFNENPLTSCSITYNNLDGMGWMKYEFTYDANKKHFLKEKLTGITYYESGSPLYKTILGKDIEKKEFVVFGVDNHEVLSIVSAKNPILYALALDENRFSNLKKWQISLQKLANSLEIVQLYNIPLDKTMEALKGYDEKEKAFITSFVKNADLSIQDFEYKKENPFIDETKISEDVLKKNEHFIDSLHLATTYKKTSVPSIVYDSSGTKKIEALAAYVYEAIMEGKTLIVDELDNGLHFRLTRAIVSAFNNMINQHGQIVFTAHDLLLIGCKMLLRKDQIYFIERDDNGATLSCLKNMVVKDGGPREGSNLIKRYNEGEFGILPSPNFIQTLILANKDKGFKE